MQFSFATLAIFQLMIILIVVTRIKLKFNSDFSLFGFNSVNPSALFLPCLLGLIYGLTTYYFGTQIEKNEGSILPSSYTVIQIIILIWLLAPISEELIFRGVLQTRFSMKFTKKFNKYLSKSNLIAALLFSSIHLGLLFNGISTSHLVLILIFTFIAGITAGYFREKTGSLLPAIILHSFANIGGSILTF